MISALGITAAVGGTSCQSPPDDKEPIGIAAGLPNQVFHQLGEGLAKVLERMNEDEALQGKGREYRFRAICSEGGSGASLKELMRNDCSGVGKNEDGVFRFVTANAAPAPPDTKTDRLIKKSAAVAQLDQVKTRLGLINCVVLEEQARQGLKDEVLGVAVLWDEYFHILISPGARLVPEKDDNGKSADGEEEIPWNPLRQLESKNPRIYLGAKGSATHLIAQQFLEDFKFVDASETGITDAKTAVDALICNRIEAVIFMTGVPNPLVAKALEGKCRLLPMVRPTQEAKSELGSIADARGNRARSQASSGSGASSSSREGDWGKNRYRSVAWLQNPDGSKVVIPEHTYPYQEDEIKTAKSATLLLVSNVSDKAFEAEEVGAILRAIFDEQNNQSGLETLVGYHEAAQKIRLLRNLEEFSQDIAKRTAMLVEFHPGAKSFYEAESSKLRIAAGPLGGASFRVGMAIVDSLAQKHIETRVLNTDGSKESRDLLVSSNQPTVDLAILQNDIAVESYDQNRTARLVGFLYPDVFHFVVRRPPVSGSNSAHSLRKFLEDSAGTNKIVALTRNSTDLDLKILEHFSAMVGPSSKSKPEHIFLPVEQAQESLISGEIDAAMFSSGIPMKPLRPLLRGHYDASDEQPEPRMKRALQKKPDFLGVDVLSLDESESKGIAGLVANEPFLEAYKIAPNTYPPDQDETRATVAVQVILACRKDTKDVDKIAGALLENEVQLRREARGLTLRDPLEMGNIASIPIHQAALEYYRARGLVVKLPEPIQGTWEWLKSRIVNNLLPFFVGFISALISAVLVPLLSTRVSDWIQYRLAGRKTADYISKASYLYLTNTYDIETKLNQLEHLWQEILNDFQGGKIRFKDALRLDKYIRGCRERLREDMDAAPRRASAAADTGDASTPVDPHTT